MYADTIIISIFKNFALLQSNLLIREEFIISQFWMEVKSVSLLKILENKIFEFIKAKFTFFDTLRYRDNSNFELKTELFWVILLIVVKLYCFSFLFVLLWVNVNKTGYFNWKLSLFFNFLLNFISDFVKLDLSFLILKLL